MKDEEPAYVAVTEFEPAGSVELVKVAVPEDRVAVPSVVEPRENVTLPVGLLDPLTAVTVAEKVTAAFS